MTQTSAPARRAKSGPPLRNEKSKQRRAEARTGYAFLLPWLLGFIVLTAGPMISSLYLSFTNYNLFEAPKWIGFDNYANLFQDDRFIQSVKVTLTYVVFGTPTKLLAALAIAMLLNSKRRGQGFYRSAFYVPSLIGASVSIAIVWKAMFGDAGPVDQILSFFGIGIGGWVGNPNMTMPMMILLTVWQFGAPMIIFLAGLKQVPAELYEAAEMDGAGWAKKFTSITLPMLSPVIFFNLLMETIHAFQIFASAFIISNGSGGPAGSTMFYTLYLYLRGFGDFRMGYASAMAWLLLIAIGIITLIFFKTSNNWVHYSGDEK
nr:MULTISPECIES: sugar ABC transporter permease [unclassified Arthrobacter]